MWYLFDYYVFPHDLAASAWTSLGLGVGLCGLLSGWQLCFQQTRWGRSLFLSYRDSVHWLLHGVASRLFLYMISTGVVNVWRGVW